MHHLRMLVAININIAAFALYCTDEVLLKKLPLLIRRILRGVSQLCGGLALRTGCGLPSRAMRLDFGIDPSIGEFHFNHARAMRIICIANHLPCLIADERKAAFQHTFMAERPQKLGKPVKAALAAVHRHENALSGARHQHIQPFPPTA